MVSASWIFSSQATYIACFFTVLSLSISAGHIIKHLMHFTAPHIQNNVVRIILICPVYAVSSVIALSLGNNGLYAEIFRDLYEAFVVYCFMYLMLEYCGGETDCVYMMENEPPLRLPLPFCCVVRQRNARFLRNCTRGVLQFVIVKPVVALIDIFLIAYNQYDNKIWKIAEVVLYNLSYSIALYCLMVFYLATKKQLKKYRPVLKFLSVKVIIFATYYQSLLVGLSSQGKHPAVTPEEALRWNDWILCCEMIFFSIALYVAFPAKEFVSGLPDKRVLKNLRHALQVKDLYQNVVHNFNPVYRDYALQSSQVEGENRAADILEEQEPVGEEPTSAHKTKKKKRLFKTMPFGSSPLARLRRPYFDSTHNQESLVGAINNPMAGSSNYEMTGVGNDVSAGTNLEFDVEFGDFTSAPVSEEFVEEMNASLDEYFASIKGNLTSRSETADPSTNNSQNFEASIPSPDCNDASAIASTSKFSRDGYNIGDREDDNNNNNSCSNSKCSVDSTDNNSLATEVV